MPVGEIVPFKVQLKKGFVPLTECKVPVATTKSAVPVPTVKFKPFHAPKLDSCVVPVPTFKLQYQT